MSYGNIPKKRRVLVDESGQLFPNKIDPGKLDLVGDNLTTTASMTIYVTTSGSDTNGDGSSAHPYKTAGRALQDVPYFIEHDVHVCVASGIYDSFPARVDRQFAGDGNLVIEGIGSAAPYAGPFAVASVAYLPDANTAGATKFTVTDAGWTPGAFYGKWVRITAGSPVGVYVPIFDNDATTLTLPMIGAWNYTATTIDIVDGPVVEFDVDHSVVFNGGIDSPGAGSNSAIWNTSSMALAGLKFKCSEDINNSFSISNAKMWLSGVEFQTYDQTLDEYIIPLVIRNSTVNETKPRNVSLFTQEHHSSWASCYFSVKSAEAAPVAEWPAASCYVYGSNILGLVTWGEVDLYDTCNVSKSTACNYFGLHGSSPWLWNCLADNTTLDQVSEGFWLRGSKARTWGLYINSVGAGNYEDAITLEGDSTLTCTYTSCNTANVAGYGLRVSHLCSAVIDAPVTLSGTAGQYKFTANGAVGSFPAANTSVTDSRGAFITSKT